MQAITGDGLLEHQKLKCLYISKKKRKVVVISPKAHSHVFDDTDYFYAKINTGHNFLL